MPSSTIRSTTDPDEYRAAIRPSNAEFTVTGRGRFSARVTKIELHNLWFQQLNECLPRIWHFGVSAERRGFCISTEGHETSFNGIQLQADEVSVLSPGKEFWHRVAGNTQIASMSLPTDHFAAISIAITGHNLTPVHDIVSVAATPSARMKLQRLHRMACDLAEATPEIIANSQAARGLEETVLESLFSCLARGSFREDTAGRRRHGLVMRRFRDLTEARSNDALYLTDVCAAIGANARTLHLCCQEHLGMGPKRYLVLRRLHLVRQALLAPTPCATVTEIATRFGFWELGRFAVIYRSLFGESPSATLRRAAH